MAFAFCTCRRAASAISSPSCRRSHTLGGTAHRSYPCRQPKGSDSRRTAIKSHGDHRRGRRWKDDADQFDPARFRSQKRRPVFVCANRKAVADDTALLFVGNIDWLGLEMYVLGALERLQRAAGTVIAPGDLAARQSECGKQPRDPVPFLILRLAGHGAPVRQLQLALQIFARRKDGFSSPATTTGFSGGAIRSICKSGHKPPILAN